MSKDTLKKVAETFLDEPVIIPIAVTEKLPQKWWERILRKRPATRQVVKQYEVTEAKVPTMVRCSGLLLDMEKPIIPNSNELEWAYTMIQQEAYRTAEIIAAAIHNDKSPVPASLIDEVFEGMSAAQLKQTAALVLDKIGVSDFIDCMILLRGMQILEEEKPAQAGEETTAPGDLSEVTESTLEQV